MRFLFLEPFFGGSHQDFARGLINNSGHEIDLVTLPARFWKWRMRGAALYFINKISNLKNYNGLITSSLMSLSDYKSLAGSSCPPALAYFHENQLTYPLAPGERMDLQYGFTDITTALAAQKVIFNSHTHLDSFFQKLPEFIRKMPEFHPDWVVDAIKSKSQVLYPGCNFPAKRIERKHLKSNQAPLVIWNHRWEFDKGPEDFLYALDNISKHGIDFRLAILGESFEKKPEIFQTIKERFSRQIIQFGYIKSKQEYYKMLKQGDIVISTANQENFGISIVEAVYHGSIPLLPNRLSYPEIIPAQFHPDFIYTSRADLIEKLKSIILNFNNFSEKRKALSHAMETYAWENMIKSYDKLLEYLAEQK